jgi:hypothetical protein
MRKMVVFWVLLTGSLFITNLYAQTECKTIENRIIMRNFDYSLLNETGGRFMQNDWLFLLRSTSMTYGEIAPANKCFMIYTEFYQSGIIQRRGYMFGNVFFGRWEYYDEQGELVRIVDEDLIFGKIKWTDILALLEKEGWFNRKTGENKILREPVLPTNGNFYYRLFENLAGIRVGFLPTQNFDGSAGRWSITIEPDFIINYHRIIYRIDGETGEFEKIEELVAPGW